MDNKQLLNEFEQDMGNYCIIKAEVCVNTNRGLNNSSYPARTEFNNCLIIFLKLSLNACFVSKNTQAANNGIA